MVKPRRKAHTGCRFTDGIEDECFASDIHFESSGVAKDLQAPKSTKHNVQPEEYCHFYRIFLFTREARFP